MIVLLVLGSCLALQVATAQNFPAPRDKFPQIISHRGACGYVPEHSLAGYQTAMDLGTDYIEPDLCISKDGQFIAMHDLLLDDTTNVASLPEYDDRYTTKDVEGKNTTGYFVNDFTVEELKTLRLKQRVSGRSTQFDYLLQIPTFEEIMMLTQTHLSTTGSLVGLYVELKHPSYHTNTLGYAMDDMLISALADGGYATSGSDAHNDMSQVVPVVVQCFETDALKSLKTKSDLPLIQLMGYSSDVSSVWNKESLDMIASYAHGVGPDKNILYKSDEAANNSYDVGVDRMQMAHEASLFVHPWTYRADSGIDSSFNSDFDVEMEFFYCCLKMDAAFTEFPDRSRQTINGMLQRDMTCTINCADYN